jgi:hypothetical protein
MKSWSDVSTIRVTEIEEFTIILSLFFCWCYSFSSFMGLEVKYIVTVTVPVQTSKTELHMDGIFQITLKFIMTFSMW